ncbi:MAG TPA: bile acid:sodium symporter family protein [Gammaproteobacteria bacterium]|nr:bile acid:sodium symporter family protein [Gammaproteobacteria bacterium]
MNETLPVQALLPWIIALLMLGIGMSLNVKDFYELRRYPQAALLACFCQFLLLPAIAFGLALLLKLPSELKFGLVLLAAVPSASSSTIFTYLAGGHVPLSVSLTAFNRLLAVITLPVYMQLAAYAFANPAPAAALPATDVLKRLGLTLLAPILAGMLLRRFAPAKAQRVQPLVRRAALALLVILILWVVWREYPELPRMFKQTGPAMLALCLGGMGLGYLCATLARVTPALRTALVLEVGLQSGGTAILIATGILLQPSMAVPAIVYSLLMYPLAGLFAWHQFIRGQARQADGA